MKDRVLISLLAIFAIVSTSAPSQTEVDSILEGFEWQQLPYINALVAKPKAWFFHHRSVPKEKRYQFLISSENVQAGIKPRILLEIIAIRDIPAKRKITPSKFAENIISEMQKKTPFEKEWKKERGVFAETGFMRETESGKDSYKECFIALANDKTGTIYTVSFKALAGEWEQAWKTGDLIFKNINFDEAQ